MPSDAAAAAIRSALDGMGGGGGAPGMGRGPPMPGGQPVSIKRDFPSGVANRTAAPPSTSTMMILRSFDVLGALGFAPAPGVTSASVHTAGRPASLCWNITKIILVESDWGMRTQPDTFRDSKRIG